MDKNSSLISSKTTSSDTESWQQIRAFLAKELSEQSYNTWFASVECVQLNDTRLAVGVPDAYYGQWLKTHYESLLHQAIQHVLGGPREVAYEIVALSASPQPALTSTQPAKTFSKKPPSREDGLNHKYTFDDFVIGPGNRFAHAAALAVCDAPAKQYNPLFIYGPVGLGKTHLMQSMAHEIKRKNPSAKILYISSEKFTNELITAIQKRNTPQFRNKYRNLDLLLIDDIHFIAEKEATQEEFFHTFNALYDAHKQIVVSSDRAPKEIPGLEERLVSRFGWGLVTDIQPPDFETRVAILKKKMEKETVVVSDDVSYFIASKIKSNIRELEGALIRVVAYGSLTGHPIDLALAQNILKDACREEEQNLSVEQIQRTVALYYHLKISDLRAKKRNRSVAKPRQIAMYLIRTLTHHSLPEIGDYFGGRDHTTVLHAYNKINKDVDKDMGLRRAIEEIQELLKRGH